MSIQEHLNKIRNAIYGREVRESIAKGIETAYDDASEYGNANMEVKLARGTNPNLNTRLNKMDEMDRQNTERIDSNYNEVTAQLAQKVDEVVFDVPSQTVKFYANERLISSIDMTTANNASLVQDYIDSLVADGSIEGVTIADGAITYEKTDFGKEVSLNLTNIILNGDFSGSVSGGFADGWEALGSGISNPKVEDGKQKWTPTTTRQSSALRSASDGGVKNGHKYYVAIQGQNLGELYYLSSSRHIGTLRAYALEKQSFIYTADVDNSAQFLIYPGIAGVESSIQQFIVIDLTETFGVGNEPSRKYMDDTLETFFENGWFDGTVNLTDNRKYAILTTKDLKVAGSQGRSVDDVLSDLSDGVVRVKPGHNLYNPANNQQGEVGSIPLGNKLILTNSNNQFVSQKIKVPNDKSITFNGFRIYAITDLEYNVIKEAEYVAYSSTHTIASSEFPSGGGYLWVSIYEEQATTNNAQIVIGDTLPPYEPFNKASALYVDDEKLFDLPLEISGGGSYFDERHNGSLAISNNEELKEELAYLKKNIGPLYDLKISGESDSETINLKRNERQKLIVHLHKREKGDFGTDNDVFLPNAKDDFSDVKFTNEKGDILPYRITYKTNDFDILADSRISGKPTLSDSNGVLYTRRNRIQYSEDGGNSWWNVSGIGAFTNPFLNLVTKDNSILFNVDSKLYRKKAPHDVDNGYEEVFDLTNNGEYPTTYIIETGMVQHPDGDIFFGAYQTARHIRIYRSSDDGLNWEQVYDVREDYQHVHAMYVDENTTPPTIYAGVDGGGGVLKTTDKGETWVDLREQSPDMPQSTDFGVVHAGNGFRLLGGETSIVGGYAIIKTENDSDFRPVLTTNAGVPMIRELGGKLFAGGAGTLGFRVGLIYMSEDEGETWEEVYSTGRLGDSGGANDGYRYMSRVGNEIFASCQGSGPNLRIVPEGSYAQVIVDVPSGSQAITIESGYAYSKEKPLDNDEELVGEKIVDLRLNEGGKVVKDYVSGKYYEGDYEWVDVGKRLANFYPYIISPSDRLSLSLSSLKGFEIDFTDADVSNGITITLWAKVNEETGFDLLVADDNTVISAHTGMGLYFNGQFRTRLSTPINPESFTKMDLTIDANNVVRTYINGSIYPSEPVVDGLLSSINNSNTLNVLRSFSHVEGDSVQHFSIRKGVVSGEQLAKEFNGGVDDNRVISGG